MKVILILNAQKYPILSACGLVNKHGDPIVLCILFKY